MKNWRIGFWIAFILLVVTNIFWLYNSFDNAVSKTYLEDEYVRTKSDVNTFQLLLENLEKKELLIKLEKLNIEKDTFTKGNNLIIPFNSFSVITSENSEALKIEKY